MSRDTGGLKAQVAMDFPIPQHSGLVVRAVACEARGPGFDPSSDQMGFSLLGY